MSEVIGGYNGEVGHSGSETSERAALKVTGRRSIQVFELVARAEKQGFTCEELERYLAVGHGAASGALTRLHRGAWITRLTEERDGQQVYVTPEYVEGRDESPYRPNVAYRDGFQTPMAMEPPAPVKPEWNDEQIIAAMTVAGIHPGNLDRIKVILKELP